MSNTRNINEGELVQYFKFADDMYWCRVIEYSQNHALLQDLRKPDAKPMKTKVLGKLNKIPFHLFKEGF